MPPPVSRRTLMQAALAGAMASALSACAANPYRPVPSGAPPSGPASGASSKQGGAREVEFQGAVHRVPVRAARVVTIGDACLEPALDVDAPVVATSAVALATVPPARRDVVRGLPVLGRGREGDPVSAADVLHHRPDLVVAVAGTDLELVHGVEASGVPVVLVRGDGAFGRDWQERVRGVADLVGAPLSAVAARERALGQQAVQVRRRHASLLAGVRIVVLRAWDTQQISAYGPDSVVGRLYTQAGARFVPSVTGRAAGVTGEVRDVLRNVDTYLAGADVVMLASDYAGGLDAFTGGSLASSDPVTGHARRNRAVIAPAGVLGVTNYAQAEFLLQSLDQALSDLTLRRAR